MLEEILSYDKKRMRAAALAKFVSIANECRKLKNFNDCMNIVCTLNNYILKGMKKTWKVMHKEVFPMIEELNKFCSHENNYGNMREEMLESVGYPCVPYLGMLLKELAFIDEGPKYTKNVEDNVLINLHKINGVGKAIDFFFQFNNQAYLYRPIEKLAILANLHPKTEQQIEDMANKIGMWCYLCIIYYVLIIKYYVFYIGYCGKIVVTLSINEYN